VTNYVPTIGGAWNTTYFTLTALKTTFRSKMTPERKGQDGGFRTFRNFREMLRDG
jgi:hypothetical protein